MLAHHHAQRHDLSHVLEVVGARHLLPDRRWLSAVADHPREGRRGGDLATLLEVLDGEGVLSDDVKLLREQTDGLAGRSRIALLLPA